MSTQHEVIKRYAQLALDNLRETGGEKPTQEMLQIQSELKMSHEQIMKEHAKISLAKI